MISFPKIGYVLGNGPTLPTKKLHLLSGAFTVGVNRILRSGFDPTVVVFSDIEIATEEEENFGRSSAIILGGQERCCTVKRGRITWIHVDHREWRCAPVPERGTLFISGNSAAGAALWMLGLGVERVQLLGCSSSVVDGKSHFYGAHPDSVEEMRYQAPDDKPRSLCRHMAALTRAFGSRVVLSDDIDSSEVEVVDQDLLKTKIMYAISIDSIRAR